MKLFLLEIDKYDYDEYDKFLIRASTEKIARAIAAKETEDHVWESTRVSCYPITPEGKTEIVISSFNAG